jgi:hypothetical protein
MKEEDEQHDHHGDEGGSKGDNGVFVDKGTVLAKPGPEMKAIVLVDVMVRLAEVLRHELLGYSKSQWIIDDITRDFM